MLTVSDGKEKQKSPPTCGDRLTYREVSFEPRRVAPRKAESELKEPAGDTGRVDDDRSLEMMDVELPDLLGRLHSKRVDPASKEARAATVA